MALCKNCKHEKTCDSEDRRDCWWETDHGRSGFFEAKEDVRESISGGRNMFNVNHEEYPPHSTEWDRHREETFYMYC